MTVRRPIVWIGKWVEIPLGDTLPSDLVGTPSTQIWTGGSASSTYANNTPNIVCGGAS